ncbi:putative membrane protein YeaQ/YmgE (transglycosylase-associated protein family) [Nocardioides kongjuensis]|uniref:Putative membrane protein YeaQ/YmgE (Transglycosylase-associated protein family) n=1 Tax=Nocardioides kongjuensis TaxID=349522 RepID=A0A852RU59_9ACTN|nr:putative membrane protein YeaQ/YmgE (transglycosylase-associated protein family) [Nocardioides kongjuensis]
MVIGLLARWMRPGRQGLNLRWTFVLGVLGAVIGGAVASGVGTGSVWELNVVGTLVGVVAAILLVGAAEGLVGRRGE